MRNQRLDLLKPYYSKNRSSTNDGDFCIFRYDIIQFEGVESVRQVYDALMFALINQEISMSEKLGDITSTTSSGTARATTGWSQMTPAACSRKSTARRLRSSPKSAMPDAQSRATARCSRTSWTWTICIRMCRPNACVAM